MIASVVMFYLEGLYVYTISKNILQLILIQNIQQLTRHQHNACRWCVSEKTETLVVITAAKKRYKQNLSQVIC